ncbi:type I-E CRISPR-associated protein Cas7/Cse4/CasC [Pauljensenia sp. UMB3104]|uniref:type I-E CRISPR-associated protein Cas7/Cse4/CasC n=1 Tax=Pauljensenia sp. UMB3104 TaxID=3046331 RepID=UPI003FA7B36A
MRRAMYRYSTINVNMLRENLGDDAVADRAVELFVDSFVRSMPTGKITTFANRTLPDVVLVQVRDDQPINMSGAFEEPVVAAQHGFAEPAIKRFVEFESRLRELTGLEAVESLVSWTTPRGESLSVLGDKVRLIDLGSATASAVRGMQ